ncbi:MAG: N-acetyltransferase family protein [Planctomycetota bacterium]
MKLRTATHDDLGAIVAIHNQGIAAGTTANLTPHTVAALEAWFDRHKPPSRPIIVAEIAATVVGWASLSDYRPGREATRHCAEISYFVDAGHQRQGVATALMQEAMDRCEDAGITMLLAILLADNHASIALLRKFEFQEWGRLPEAVITSTGAIDHLYLGRRV